MASRPTDVALRTTDARTLDLAVNPLMDKLKPDPDNDERQFVVLHAYVAKVTPRTVTVYTNLDLSSYLEIPCGAIKWAEKVIPGQDSSPTKLVIAAGTEVKRVTTKKIEASFLGGLVARNHLASSACGLLSNAVLEPYGVSSCPPATASTDAKAAPRMSGCRLTSLCYSDPIQTQT
jgi:hypothetical protein